MFLEAIHYKVTLGTIFYDMYRLVLLLKNRSFNTCSIQRQNLSKIYNFLHIIISGRGDHRGSCHLYTTFILKFRDVSISKSLWRHLRHNCTCTHAYICAHMHRDTYTPGYLTYMHGCVGYKFRTRIMFPYLLPQCKEHEF